MAGARAASAAQARRAALPELGTLARRGAVNGEWTGPAPAGTQARPRSVSRAAISGDIVLASPMPDGRCRRWPVVTSGRITTVAHLCWRSTLARREPSWPSEQSRAARASPSDRPIPCLLVALSSCGLVFLWRLPSSFPAGWGVPPMAAGDGHGAGKCANST